MRLSDFDSLVHRLATEVPAEFLEGIVDITVSPRTVVHPGREEVWTLGECIPLPGDDGNPHHLQSRVVLYHGSFSALARDRPDFDWRDETWETLTHEIRHHVEWKARAPGLEAYDAAAEANFARQDGERFDPWFYRDGIPLGEELWQVDDDVFLERTVQEVPARIRIRWQGVDSEVALLPEHRPPAFLTVTGLEHPPAGDFVLVLQAPRRVRDLFRRGPVASAEVEARRVDG